jgi:hypothetical protein
MLQSICRRPAGASGRPSRPRGLSRQKMAARRAGTPRPWPPRSIRRNPTVCRRFGRGCAKPSRRRNPRSKRECRISAAPPFWRLDGIHCGLRLRRDLRIDAGSQEAHVPMVRLPAPRAHGGASASAFDAVVFRRKILDRLKGPVTLHASPRRLGANRRAPLSWALAAVVAASLAMGAARREIH